MPDAYVADFDQRLSREALEARAARGASALVALGAGADVAVAVIMRNDLQQLEIMRAAALAGTVIVALNWHAAADEVAAICEDSGARIIIIHRDLIEALRPVTKGRKVIAVTPGPALCTAYNIDRQQATSNPDSIEWSSLVESHSPLMKREMMRPLMRYTSGSTGAPKGVRRIGSGPRKDFEEVLRRVGAEMLRLKSGSRFFTAAPIYHSAPSTLISAAMASDGVSSLVAAKFEPEAFLATIAAQKITHIYLVPTMMSRMLKLPDDVKERYDLSSVEFCVSTGSPWPHDLKKAMIEWWGPVFWESYGATEIGFHDHGFFGRRTCQTGYGRAHADGCTVLILDADGNKLPARGDG